MLRNYNLRTDGNIKQKKERFLAFIGVDREFEDLLWDHDQNPCTCTRNGGPVTEMHASPPAVIETKNDQKPEKTRVYAKRPGEKETSRVMKQ